MHHNAKTRTTQYKPSRTPKTSENENHRKPQNDTGHLTRNIEIKSAPQNPGTSKAEMGLFDLGRENMDLFDLGRKVHEMLFFGVRFVAGHGK